jgi:hypothetical protein
VKKSGNAFRRGKKRTANVKTDAAIRHHAERRFLQRYDGLPDGELLEALFAKVRAGQARSERQSNTVSEHLVEHEGRTYRFIYDRKRKLVRTWLPVRA